MQEKLIYKSKTDFTDEFKYILLLELSSVTDNGMCVLQMKIKSLELKLGHLLSKNKFCHAKMVPVQHWYAEQCLLVAL